MALIVTEVHYMTKTPVITYGDVTIPTSVVLGSVMVELMNSAGSMVERRFVSYGSQTESFSIPSGTGWKFRVTNLDLGLSAIGDPFETAPFDVVETRTVSLAIGVSA